jgi:hypothetical protein
MKKISKEEIMKIAQEMYEHDGTYFSERYSSSAWDKRGWPTIDDPIVYKMLDAHIKLLRTYDEYIDENREEPLKRRDIFGRVKRPGFSKT